MKHVLIFLFWLFVAVVAISLTIVLGERGAWYFAWVLGTVMIVLIAAAGTAVSRCHCVRPHLIAIR